MAEKENVIVRQLDEIIDWWDDELDENGNVIFASPRLEEKFEEAGWTKEDARIEGVRLVKLSEDLSNYAAPSRKKAWFAKNNNNGTCFLGVINEPDQSRMKPIETYYKGCRFRSRLEARWAVFFDQCYADWEYEPEGFDLGDGIWYLPDFYLPKFKLWVEVKGVMSKSDEEKILKFSGYEAGMFGDEIKNPIYIVGSLPKGSTGFDMMCDMQSRAYSGRVPLFNSLLDYGDMFGEFPLVDESGHLIFCGDDWNYMTDVDWGKTKSAYDAALGARFEHGEHGSNNN